MGPEDEPDEAEHLEADQPDLVPASMLRSYSYCPRQFYLEWVARERNDTSDLLEGRRAHRVVDQPTGAAPLPDEGQVIAARSVTVSSERLGLIAVIDLLQGDGDQVIPVETKRGAGPEGGRDAWDGDLLQLTAQILLLRDAGYSCDRGVIYYAASRERVTVAVSKELEAETLRVLQELRTVAGAPEAPAPLVNSPKCPRCSLVGICMPDEINLLRGRREVRPRRLVPSRDDAAPMYVVEQGSVVRMREGRIIVTLQDQELASFREIDVSHLCVFGSVQVTASAIQHLLAHDIPVCWFSYGGWFYGMATGLPSKHVALRLAQYRRASSPDALFAARAFVAGKVRNCRTLLRRNARGDVTEVVERLHAGRMAALSAESIETLLGIEGSQAKAYFSVFQRMLAPAPAERFAFDFHGRNRRPPRDEVNALLSFVYTLLVKDATVACVTVGLDPLLGCFHRPRYGRPALALDLMEEFRPLIGDSVVIQVINNGEVRASDFVRRAGAVSLRTGGRRKVLEAYERRMAHVVRHPVFGYRVSYRRALEVQARLLAAWFLGEARQYEAFVTR